MPQLTTKLIPVVAVSSAERTQQFPAIPTLAESDYDKYERVVRISGARIE